MEEHPEVMPDCIPLQPTQEFQTARLLLSHLNLLTLNAVKPKPQARIGPDVRYFSSCFDRATRHRGADIKGHSYFSAKCIRTHLAFFCCVLLCPNFCVYVINIHHCRSQGSYAVLKSMERYGIKFGQFPDWKRLEKNFFLVC